MDKHEQGLWQRLTDWDKSFFINEVFFPAYKRLVEISVINAHGDTPVARGMIEEIFDEAKPLIRYQAEETHSMMLDKLRNAEGGIELAALVKALKHPDPDMRIAATKELGNLSDNTCVADLILALKDPDSVVRLEAADALRKIEDDRVIPGLIELTEDHVDAVRLVAVRALGAFCDQRILPVLAKSLGDKMSLVRFSAEKDLIQYGPNSITVLIEATCSMDVNKQEGATRAILTIGMSGVPALCDALLSKDWDVRANVAKLLGEIGDRRAAWVLSLVLKDENAKVRCDAAEALGKICDPDFVAPLIESLTDNSRNVREKALWAVKNTIDKSGSIEVVDTVEGGIIEGRGRISGMQTGRNKTPNLLMQVSGLRKACNEKRAELLQIEMQLAIEREVFDNIICLNKNPLQIQNSGEKRAPSQERKRVVNG